MSRMDLEGHTEIHQITRENKYFMQKEQHVQTHTEKQLNSDNEQQQIANNLIGLDDKVQKLFRAKFM